VTPSEPAGVRSESRDFRPVLVIVRMGWALFLLGAPPRLLQSLGAPSTGYGLKLVRVLGVRHLLQAAAQTGGGRHYRDGALIDLLHALSMLLLAAVNAGRRRAAVVDAAIAGSFLAWEWTLSVPPTVNSAHHRR
jgi:hypothetical protein